MIIGTTPTHIFSVSIDLREADEVYVNYAQGSISLEKTKSDLEITEDEVFVTLTQEETMMFSPCGFKAEIQFTAEFGDVVRKSNIELLDITRSVKVGMI